VEVDIAERHDQSHHARPGFKPGDDEPTYWLGVTQSLTTVDELAHALGLYRSIALSLRDDLEQDRAWAVRLYGPQGGPPTSPMSAKPSPTYWTLHARPSSRNGKRRAGEGGRTSGEHLATHLGA
jgi:hypothetical protein